MDNCWWWWLPLSLWLDTICTLATLFPLPTNTGENVLDMWPPWEHLLVALACYLPTAPWIFSQSYSQTDQTFPSHHCSLIIFFSVQVCCWVAARQSCSNTNTDAWSNDPKCEGNLCKVYELYPGPSGLCVYVWVCGGEVMVVVVVVVCGQTAFTHVPVCSRYSVWCVPGSDQDTAWPTHTHIIICTDKHAVVSLFIRPFMCT